MRYKLPSPYFFSLGCLFILPLAVAAQASTSSAFDAETYPRTSNEFVAAVVIDVASGERLYAYAADQAWPAASLTKLMTALVFLDRQPRWDRVTALTKGDEVGGGRLRVRTGTRVSVRDLFYSSLVGSANNTTMALVRTSGVGLKKFIQRMNLKTKVMGLKQTKFVDPTGISPRNVSTAADLATLGLVAFRNPNIRQAAATSEYAFNLRNTGQKKVIHNTNHLLTRDPEILVTGGKTGYLVEARHNLVVELSANTGATQAPKLMVVVLGAPSSAAMFASAKSLAQWAWKAYEW